MASPRVLLTMTSYRPQVCWWQRAPECVSSSFLPGCIVTALSRINNLSIAVRLQCSVTQEFGASVVFGIKDYFRYTEEQAQTRWQRQKLGAGLGQETLCGNFEKEEVWLVGIKKVSSGISRYLLLEAKQIHLLANCVCEWETVYQTSWQWGWTPKRQRVGHLSTSWLKCDLLCKKKIKTKTKHWLRNKEKGEKQLCSSRLGYSPVKGHS